MKAAFALLVDHEVHNVARKLALEVHRNYGIGLAASQLPPHVSLKQPFSIPDLHAIEVYFDRLAASIEPVALIFPRIGGPADGPFPVLWLEVEESATLRELHSRINRELAEQFANTQAPFDGPTYHFHLTIALGRDPDPVYQSIIAELARREIALRTIARRLVMFYYDEEPISPGSFLTYKILPLGKTNPRLYKAMEED